jgi:hypothetical protein
VEEAEETKRVVYQALGFINLCLGRIEALRSSSHTESFAEFSSLQQERSDAQQDLPHQAFAGCSYREKLIKNPSPVPAGRIKDIDNSEEEVESQPGASRKKDKPRLETLPQIQQAPATPTTKYFAPPSNNNPRLRRTSSPWCSRIVDLEEIRVVNHHHLNFLSK